MSNEFQAYLDEHGIEVRKSTRATPQRNGVAERRNRILDEGISTLLSASGLPSLFWAEALNAVQTTLPLLC